MPPPARRASTAQNTLKYSRNSLTTNVCGRRWLNQRVGMVGFGMADSLAGIVLAAGAGTRLMPLTALRPKALCPVGHRSLLAHALDRVGAATGSVAVNVHHGAEQICAHLADRRVVGEHEVHISHESREALGTAGAVGRLNGWFDGRAALVVNADTWHQADLRAFRRDVADGLRRSRCSPTTPGPFGPSSTVVASLLPGHVAAGLAPVPSGSVGGAVAP